MPDPIVITPAGKFHSVFDAGTGYHVISKPAGWFDAHPAGEGDSEKFVIIEHKEGELPEQYTDWDDEGNRTYVAKLDLFIARTKKPLVRAIDNIIGLRNLVFTEGDDADFRQLRKTIDTRQNALRHVGTGYAFATIQGAINASASGDGVVVHETVGNAYNENITDNALDGVQLVSAVPNQGIRIWSAAGNIVVINGNDSWLVENFEIDGVGTAQRGLYFVNAGGCVARGVIAHDVTGEAIFMSGTGDPAYLGIDCVGYNAQNGIRGGTLDDAKFIHCTACCCVNNGFLGAANALNAVACLSFSNGVDYLNNNVAGCAWNVSQDLTAPGPGSRTNFNPANIINIWQLAFEGENGANIDGWPLDPEDALRNERSRDTLIFYAGAHDPYVAPGPGAPICCGAIDAAPAAQGCILVRFCEMDCDDLTVPYRYDFHVKHLSLGPLTCDEINAGTWYARSCYNDEVNFAPGSPEIGSPGPNPAILQALIAFEAWNQHGDNIHLFTNREYQIAVRAVAIDANDTIYEDDNCEVVISYSSGYQGIQWSHILSWPCTYFCDGEHLDVGLGDAINVNVGALPAVNVNDIGVERMPNLDVGMRSGMNIQDAIGELGRQFGQKIGELMNVAQQRRR